MEDRITTDRTKARARTRGAFFRDERFLQILAQVIFVLIVIFVIAVLYKNMSDALARQGLVLGIDFLKSTAGFDISQRLFSYDRSSPNLNAILIGLLNTILVSVISIILSTILGTLVGIARLSKNFLINRIAWLYIEVFRNVPLLLVIVATYSMTIYNLPNINDAINIADKIIICNRGIYVPKPISTSLTGTYLLFLAIGLVISFIVARIITKKRKLDNFLTFAIALAMLIVIAVVIWVFMPDTPFSTEFPIRKGLNYKGGISLSPELVAMALGLVLGSSPFTADTIRAGIQQVSKGQIEAARALGMSNYQTMRFVIFPQALRVIVPPMTSNYLSLTKNSSLATAIAYPELVHVTSTISSQTGRSVEIMTIVMLIYLILSLITSLVMNWYNNRIKLVER